jgi:hypothetical protein
MTSWTAGTMHANRFGTTVRTTGNLKVRLIRFSRPRGGGGKQTRVLGSIKL